jgi:hypothetical protein
MTAYKTPEEMDKLAVAGTFWSTLGGHKPKLIVLSTGEELKIDMFTFSRPRAINAAKRLAKGSGFTVVEVTCSKCHKSGRAEYARGQRDALLAVDEQIGRVKKQAADFLRYMQEESPAGDVATEGRLRGLDEALREVKALLARVGRGE